MSTMIRSSVLEEIKRLHDNESSGTLIVTANGQRIYICFREGLIDCVSSNISGCRLGDYLQKEAYATAQEVDSMAAFAKQEKILLGEAFVRKGRLNQAVIGVVVRRQVSELLDSVFKNGFEVDSFQSQLRSYYAPARVGLMQIMLELCRNNAQPFEPSAETCVALVPDSDLSPFQWTPQELYVISELAHPSTFAQLLKSTALPHTILTKTLGVLRTLDLIETLPVDSTAGATEAIAANSDFSIGRMIPVVTNALLHEKLEVARNDTSFTSEQFKNLKVQINEVGALNPLKVLTISSPDPKDGKSLVGTNLAFSFALDPGRRVIVVDCDLRNPSLNEYLGVPSEPGLLQYLANGHLSPNCYLRRVDNLYFLTTGGVAPNPVEILSMNKMKQLIEHLKKDFDTIIIDAPPYWPVADARIVTSMSDGLIMVVRRGRTSCSSSDRAFKAVDRKKLLGIVFNDVQPLLFNTDYKFGYYEYGAEKKVHSNAPRIGQGPKSLLKP